jgi:Winged helix-turn helix
MARTARYDEGELKAALKLVTEATTVQELRQGQAVLLPALTGASLETTAEVLGLSRDRVCVLRRQFGELLKTPSKFKEERRGGRRRQLMSIEEEKEFLVPWVEKAATGGVLVVPPIHLAFQERVGRSVPKSTIYRLLARHGWRKITPDTRHPKVDVTAQEEFKKNSKKLSQNK